MKCDCGSSGLHYICSKKERNKNQTYTSFLKSFLVWKDKNKLHYFIATVYGDFVAQHENVFNHISHPHSAQVFVFLDKYGMLIKLIVEILESDSESWWCNIFTKLTVLMIAEEVCQICAVNQNFCHDNEKLHDVHLS